MTKVFLGDRFCETSNVLRRIRALAKAYPPKEFQIVEKSELADIRFDVGGLMGNRPCLEPVIKDQPRYLFCENDIPTTIMPGIYPSLLKHCDWAASWAYIPDINFPESPRLEPELLFSFVGRKNSHRCRTKILELNTELTPCLDSKQATHRFSFWDYRTSFVDLMERSHFSLCPRGIGSSSIRLFESMRLGRVPVIIADAWIEPPGVDWSSFSIRVPESDIKDIPSICAARKDDAKEMGYIAKKIYDELYSPDVWIDRTISFCLKTFGDNYNELCIKAKTDNLDKIKARANAARSASSNLYRS